MTRSRESYRTVNTRTRVPPTEQRLGGREVFAEREGRKE